MLPDEIRKTKIVNVATLDSYLPWSLFDGSAFKGVDADLLNAISPLLGVTFKLSPLAVTAQVPALLAGRFDMIMNSLQDTQAREQQVDMVDYALAGAGIVASKGSAPGITTDHDLCGKTGAVIGGSAILTALQDINKQSCGSDPINIQTTTSTGGADLAVASGRATFAVEPYTYQTYYLKHVTSGPLTHLAITSVPQFDVLYAGIAFDKKATQLRDAVRAALQELLANGTYQRTLAKWECPEVGIAKLAVNGAAGPIPSPTASAAS
jgi:polar amino acid transport system substrate-binding protein